METKKDLTREKFKDYVWHSTCPDINSFCRISGTSINVINSDSYGPLREAALAKKIYYLENKLGNFTIQDRRYDGEIGQKINSNLIYDMMKNAPEDLPKPRVSSKPKVFECEDGIPCRYVQTKIKSDRGKRVMFWVKQIIITAALFAWGMIGGIVAGKLLAMWI
jgi:hypothetical protein